MTDDGTEGGRGYNEDHSGCGKKLNLKDINRNTVLFLVSEVKRLLRSPESVRRSEKRKSKSSREISLREMSDQ